MDIKELRTSLNLSKQELADYLGVNSRTVRRWESGESRPSQLAMKGLRTLTEKPHRGLVKRLVDRLLGGR